MCAGFFLIAALEEAIHHLLHPATTSDTMEEAKAEMDTIEEAKKEAMEEAKEGVRDQEEERSAARAKAAIRSVFVVFALSFHSIVEGERRHAVLAFQLYFFSHYANK